MKKKLLVGIITMIVILTFTVSCTNIVEDEKMIQKKETIIKFDNENLKTATFAGGCFWCMEAALEISDGVIDVVSGYAGGEKENPTYKEVLSGKTGHKEAINITFNSKKVSYEQLLDLFWRQIDPTDDGGQFADRGPQYKTAIFYHDENQKKLAEESKEKLEKSGKFDKPIVTEIIAYTNFYPAEEYHQDYSKKRNAQYKLYEKGSGRLKYKEEMWGEEE
jgi:peptide methionine sulfoxide reductase msrA/msrB